MYRALKALTVFHKEHEGKYQTVNFNVTEDKKIKCKFGEELY